jgi:hypothetical protein
MDFMILDSAGNAVEAFESERDAIKALLGIADEDRRAAQHLAILAFDSDGDAIGEPLTVADVRPEAASTLVMVGNIWERRGTLTLWSPPAGAAAPLRLVEP